MTDIHLLLAMALPVKEGLVSRGKLSLCKKICLYGLITQSWTASFDYIIVNSSWQILMNTPFLFWPRVHLHFTHWATSFHSSSCNHACQKHILSICTKWTGFQPRSESHHNVSFGKLFWASFQVLYGKCYNTYILAISMCS